MQVEVKAFLDIFRFIRFVYVKWDGRIQNMVYSIESLINNFNLSLASIIPFDHFYLKKS